MLDILHLPVKVPGEQMLQIMREHLPRRHFGRLAQCFHHRPDVGTVQRPSSAGDKHRPTPDVSAPAVGKQPDAQGPGQKHRAVLPLVADLGPALLDRKSVV